MRKQAKIITEAQEKACTSYLSTKRYPLRSLAMFYLSIKAGLRACEIAGITWQMVTDSEGNISDTIQLHDNVAKKKGGREIPMHSKLKEVLTALYNEAQPKPQHNIITSERGEKRSANSVTVFFSKLYKELGFAGCSSHSGRRTFGTRLAQNLERSEASLRDVQQLLGHANLQTTQHYIEGNSKAKRNLIGSL